MHFPLLQKYNLLQYFRNFAAFVAANWFRYSALVMKTEELNAGKLDRDQVVRVEPFRNNPGLNLGDYAQVGEWLMDVHSVKGDALNKMLKQLKFRRMVVYHVYGAPDTVVHPSLSMSPKSY